jgi:hypothetical protein
MGNGSVKARTQRYKNRERTGAGVAESTEAPRAVTLLALSLTRCPWSNLFFRVSPPRLIRVCRGATSSLFVPLTDTERLARRRLYGDAIPNSGLLMRMQRLPTPTTASMSMCAYRRRNGRIR